MESPAEYSKRDLKTLCERHGVERLALFGSALRDDFDPEKSDPDFSVDFSPMSPERHAAAYLGLLEDLEELFGRRVDLVEIGAVRNPYPPEHRGGRRNRPRAGVARFRWWARR